MKLAPARTPALSSVFEIVLRFQRPIDFRKSIGLPLFLGLADDFRDGGMAGSPRRYRSSRDAGSLRPCGHTSYTGRVASAGH
jgi:hypothetical protein